jgi:hypothetical protein
MPDNNNIKSEQTKMILRMAAASAAVARAKNWILRHREEKDAFNLHKEPHMITLPGLDYLAVKKNPTPAEKRLVDEHEKTRLARSRARIEAEFPSILAPDDDQT